MTPRQVFASLDPMTTIPRSGDAGPPHHSDPPTPTRSRRLSFDLLRIVCIAGVVGIHCFGPMAANPSNLASWTWFPAAAMSFGMMWVVPVFVMLSGALTLAPRVHRAGSGAFLRRRAARILPALVVWTFVYLVPIRMLVLGESFSGGQIVTALVDGSVYPHLYFLYLIAGLAFVAPVLAPFLHTGGPGRALGLGAVLMAYTVVVFAIPGVLDLFGIERPITLGALTIWLAYAGFYVMGFALADTELPRRARVVAAVVGMLMWALLLVQTAAHGRWPVLDAVFRPDYQGVGVALLSLAVFVVAVPLLDRIRVAARLERVIASLSDAAFGVYLVHLIVLLVPYWLLPGFQKSPASLAQSALAYVVVLTVSFGISLGARRVPGVRMIF